MQSTGLARQYDRLNHRERLQLVLAAMGRGDSAEVARLHDTCPRSNYRAAAAGFRGPYEAVRRIVLGLAIDMAYELGQLHMQEKYTRLLPAIMMMAADETLLQEGAIAEEMAVPEAMDVEEDGPADRPTAEAPSPEVAGSLADHDRECAAFLPRSHQCVGEVNDRLVRKVGQRVNGMMQGLDRFAQRVLGMEGTALLQAWMPVLLEWMAELDITDVPADEDVAVAAEAKITAIWRKVVGRG